jgi:hypothetical protein
MTPPFPASRYGVTYRCNRCGGEFVSDRSQEEADSEFFVLYGKRRQECTTITVCHDCWLLLREAPKCP